MVEVDAKEKREDNVAFSKFCLKNHFLIAN